MLANVVMVWREIFSHVEGVVERQRRVWITGRPLAPSPVALAVLSECYGERRSSEFFAHTRSRHLWSGPGCGLCESANDSHEHQSVLAEKLGDFSCSSGESSHGVLVSSQHTSS